MPAAASEVRARKGRGADVCGRGRAASLVMLVDSEMMVCAITLSAVTSSPGRRFQVAGSRPQTPPRDSDRPGSEAPDGSTTIKVARTRPDSMTRTRSRPGERLR